MIGWLPQVPSCLSLCGKDKKNKQKKQNKCIFWEMVNKARCAACAVFCGLVYSVNWHNCQRAHSWGEHPLWLRCVFRPCQAKPRMTYFTAYCLQAQVAQTQTVFSNSILSDIFWFCLIFMEMWPLYIMWKLSSLFLFKTCGVLIQRPLYTFKWLHVQTADPTSEFSPKKNNPYWIVTLLHFLILW